MPIKNIDSYDIADALMERPIGFELNGRHFRLYPLSLGKIQLISRLAGSIGLSGESRVQSFMRSLSRSAKADRESCLRIIAYASLEGKECMYEEVVQERISLLRGIEDEDLSVLMSVILTQDASEALIGHFHLDVERKEMEKAMKAKSGSGNTLTFGGKSIWGTLIDFACERYGWTVEYVVWGISWCNLQMLMADHVKNIFLTDRERKGVPVSTDGVVVKAEDVDSLKELIRNSSWK